MIGITKPLRSLFPVSGDDPALIGFYLGNDSKDSTFKRSKEQPDESAVVPTAYGRFDDRCGIVYCKLRLFDSEAAFARTHQPKGVSPFFLHFAGRWESANENCRPRARVIGVNI